MYIYTLAAPSFAPRNPSRSISWRYDYTFLSPEAWRNGGVVSLRLGTPVCEMDFSYTSPIVNELLRSRTDRLPVPRRISTLLTGYVTGIQCVGQTTICTFKRKLAMFFVSSPLSFCNVLLPIFVLSICGIDRHAFWIEFTINFGDEVN